MTSDEIVTLREAAQETGRTLKSLQLAAQRRRLNARKVGDAHRAVWVTTREDVARWVAQVQLLPAPGRPSSRAVR